MHGFTLRLRGAITKMSTEKCHICNADVPALDICRFVPDGERFTKDCLHICKDCLDRIGVSYELDPEKQLK